MNEAQILQGIIKSKAEHSQDEPELLSWIAYAKSKDFTDLQKELIDLHQSRYGKGQPLSKQEAIDLWSSLTVKKGTAPHFDLLKAKAVNEGFIIKKTEVNYAKGKGVNVKFSEDLIYRLSKATL